MTRRGARTLLRMLRVSLAGALVLGPMAAHAAVVYGTFSGTISSGQSYYSGPFALFGLPIPNLGGVNITGDFTIDTNQGTDNYAYDPNYSYHTGVPGTAAYSERLLAMRICANGVCYAISDAGVVDHGSGDAESVVMLQRNPPTYSPGTPDFIQLFDQDVDQCSGGNCPTAYQQNQMLIRGDIVASGYSADSLLQSFVWSRASNGSTGSLSGNFSIYDYSGRTAGQPPAYGYGDFNLNSLCYNSNCSLAPVPLPAAAWLLLSGLAGLGFVARRRTAL